MKISEPLPANWTVREGRDAYLAENGFSLESYVAPTGKISARLPGFTLRIRVPNPAARRRAIPLHDLHHVVTGFGTDVVGEAEISAWEMQRGFGAIGLYPRALIVLALVAGLLVAPRRTLRAWGACRGECSLYHERIAYDRILSMRIGELRAMLGMREEGLATAPRRLHALAPTTSERMV
jgi:hypothetical protein